MEEFYRRIVGRRYWFSGPESGLAPTCCVAIHSKSGESWAAYISGVPVMEPEDDAMASLVAAAGAKLDERTARAMFPEVVGEYRA